MFLTSLPCAFDKLLGNMLMNGDMIGLDTLLRLCLVSFRLLLLLKVLQFLRFRRHSSRELRRTARYSVAKYRQTWGCPFHFLLIFWHGITPVLTICIYFFLLLCTYLWAGSSIPVEVEDDFIVYTKVTSKNLWINPLNTVSYPDNEKFY